MKKRSKRMSKVVAVAQSEERRVCLEMGRAQQAVDADVERLQELEAYRHSYSREFTFTGNVSSQRWQDYQNFLRRIDDAVAAQKEQVLTGQQNRDAHRRRWMRTRQRVESLERVVDRYREVEDREDARQQQKSLDDLAARPRMRR